MRMKKPLIWGVGVWREYGLYLLLEVRHFGNWISFASSLFVYMDGAKRCRGAVGMSMQAVRQSIEQFPTMDIPAKERLKAGNKHL